VIAPESIDPFALPWLPLKWQRRLPRCHGIYIAISQEEEILYMVKRPSRITTKVRKSNREKLRANNSCKLPCTNSSAKARFRVQWLQIV